MQVSAELDNGLTAEIVRQIVVELTPIIVEKVKAEYAIETPVSKKEIAKIIGCDQKYIDGYENNGMPFTEVGRNHRYFPSQCNRWQIKHQQGEIQQ